MSKVWVILTFFNFYILLRGSQNGHPSICYLCGWKSPLPQLIKRYPVGEKEMFRRLTPVMTLIIPLCWRSINFCRYKSLFISILFDFCVINDAFIGCKDMQEFWNLQIFVIFFSPFLLFLLLFVSLQSKSSCFWLMNTAPDCISGGKGSWAICFLR